MEPLLYLVHRIPYPPNKGDKIVSYHLLRYLTARYRVHLGCFVDCPGDSQYVSVLREMCAEVRTFPLNPLLARLRSLSGFVTGESLTLPYYRDARLQAWVDTVVRREAVHKAVAFSSPMAQYLRPFPEMRTIVDLVDVDSAKWTAFAARCRWPLSALYRREGKQLLRFEREAVARSAAGVLVTAAEVKLFQQLAPECQDKVYAVEAGVDSDYFAPSAERVSPYSSSDCVIVFTGAMDYWPNIDAVTWFVEEVLPGIARERPDVRFYIVGMNPSKAVRALASNSRVVVTGRVDDVRPYVQHAAAVVAPLRVARGVQNKVLEAMAMARPVLVSTVAAAGLRVTRGVELETASDAGEFAHRTLALLDSETGRRMGERARTRICADYSWSANLQRFDFLLDGLPTEEMAPERGPIALEMVA